MNALWLFAVIATGYIGYVLGYYYGYTHCEQKHSGVHLVDKFKWLWQLLFVLGVVLGFLLAEIK